MNNLRNNNLKTFFIIFNQNVLKYLVKKKLNYNTKLILYFQFNNK